METLLKHAQNANNLDKTQRSDDCSYNFRRVTKAEEKEAFLYTSKINAAKIFSKHL